MAGREIACERAMHASARKIANMRERYILARMSVLRKELPRPARHTAEPTTCVWPEAGGFAKTLPHYQSPPTTPNVHHALFNGILFHFPRLPFPCFHAYATKTHDTTNHAFLPTPHRSRSLSIFEPTMISSSRIKRATVVGRYRLGMSETNQYHHHHSMLGNGRAYTHAQISIVLYQNCSSNGVNIPAKINNNQ